MLQLLRKLLCKSESGWNLSKFAYEFELLVENTRVPCVLRICQFFLMPTNMTIHRNSLCIETAGLKFTFWNNSHISKTEYNFRRILFHRWFHSNKFVSLAFLFMVLCDFRALWPHTWSKSDRFEYLMNRDHVKCLKKNGICSCVRDAIWVLITTYFVGKKIAVRQCGAKSRMNRKLTKP